MDGDLNCFISLAAEQALEQAREADRRIKDGKDLTPLTGIPLAIKDIFCVKGMAATAGSRILAGFRPPFDSTLTARLRRAGAVFLGKANMDEFAMGSSNESSGYGAVKNPWDRARTPGGSSGGSAAAVAAGLCMAATGTDTGGSIRQPASLCGIAGLKPTYGRVSRYGMIAYASSLDQGGPMARCVEDCALILQQIAGIDPRDSTSADVPVPDYAAAAGRGVKGLRVGMPWKFFGEGLDPEVDQAVRRAVSLLESLGATAVDIELPHADYALAAYYLVATAEASSNLARFDGVKYGFRAKNCVDLLDMYKSTRSQGFGDEVKRRIMLGTFALSAGYYDAYYRKAQQVRTLIRRDYELAFKRCDVIASPTSPTPAFRLGEKVSDPLQMYLSDIYTIPVNLAGLPGMSIPCGFSQGGLPIGLQLVGGPFREEDVLRAASAHESATEFHLKRPVDARS